MDGMKCRLCEANLDGKAYFMAILPNHMVQRGPFCNSEACMLMIRGQVDQLNGIPQSGFVLNANPSG